MSIRKKNQFLFHPVTGNNVYVSIGVALYNLGEHPDAFVKRADKALYIAKKHGKNRTQIAN
ncbi:MAG: diguanylate cyclase [Desulfobacteraceae bacterium]|nr:diguanylate cyclase [Desulfobacteraceae bacterium]